jgi:hypothetical protein
MAFLGLTDLKFINTNKRNSDNSTISEDTFRYPLNLGTTERGHYVVFYINVYGEPTGGAQTTAQKNADLLNAKGKNNMSVVPNAQKALSSASLFAGTNSEYSIEMSNAGIPPSSYDKVAELVSPAGSAIASGAKKILNSSQRYRRTTQTIALYMPNTLQFDYRQQYNTANATEAMGKIGFVAQGGSTLYETGLSESGLNNMKSFLGEAGLGILKKTGKISDAFGNMIMQGAFDTAVNPQVELLYSHPELRTFQFAFDFYPQSIAEAQTIDEIIRLFKYHSAPEIQANSAGRYFTPPGSFDIEFMYNGVPNKNIAKISTCVIDGIQVNYAPNGFSAMEVNPGDPNTNKKGDGMPSHINLTMTFREMEIITKDLLDPNFANDGNTF